MQKRTKPKTVTEVLVRALEVFGPNGEHWNNYALHDTSPAGETYCALGALGKTIGDINASYVSDHDSVVYQAATLVAQCVPKGHIDPEYKHIPDYIPDWNDSLTAGKQGFRSIKSVFCRAIKKSMQQEGGGKRKATAKRHA